MNRLIIKLLAILLFFLINTEKSVCQEQLVNQFDSIGNKTGVWVEFKIYPTKSKAIHSSPRSLKTSQMAYYDTLINNHILMKQSGVYENGFRSGVWKEFFYNGNLRIVTNYSMGKLTGDFQLFHFNSNIKAKGTITRDKYILIEGFDEEGSLIGKRNVLTSDIIRMILLE